MRELTDLTEELHEIISRQVNKDADPFDDKLADYIFFPLSHVFRDHTSHPARLVEVALKCLTALIMHGWKAKIAPKIVEQLLILLTFIVGGVPGKDGPDVDHDIPEETTLEALRSLTALLNAAHSSSAAAASLVSAKSVPTLGHAVTVVLESIANGKTPEIQLESLRTLQALFIGVKDHAALATFLPGVVSSLTKLLSTPAREKTRVLVSSIQTLKLVLTAVLSDMRTRPILAKAKPDEPSAEDQQKILSPSWLRATVSQIKLALSTVLKLRTSQTRSVRDALSNLAVTLLDECHATLENCASILVESAIMLEPEDEATSVLSTSLTDLASIYPELGESVKITVYNWITSLPRIMQSADEGNKQSAIRNVLKGTSIATQLQLDSSTLDDAISLALRDSVSFLVADGGPKPVVNLMPANPELLNSGSLVRQDGAMADYPLVVMDLESQVATRAEILSLVSKVGSTSQQVKLALEMLDCTRELSGTAQVSSYWLSFELVKAAFARSSDEVNEFFDLTSATTVGSEDPGPAFQELYTYSVSLLDDHSETTEADWRLEAIALEVAAFAAFRTGKDFRPELIDVLYPIATFLGSPIPQLREHAITTLNILATCCDYASVSELVIENVDYMVNSISLRMNTLDITPASTKVLIMMARLTGPRLIPYLDDVVASIFAALDNYHGYPVFVESLFAVLREVVDQGVRSDRLLLEGRENGPSTHRKKRPKPTEVQDILDILDKRNERKRQREEDDEAEKLITGHPKVPWGPGKDKSRSKSLVDEVRGEVADEDENEEEDGHQSSSGGLEKEKPPKTPTYTLLERVANLTQHYLTSPTPSLRRSLLSLLATVSPALSADEDAFLPLVNAVWPVVVARLYDGEPFVVEAACDALGALCAAAGDFLSSRIKTEWWDGLGKWCRRRKEDATRARARGVRGGKDPHRGPTVIATGRSETSRSNTSQIISMPGPMGSAVETKPSSFSTSSPLAHPDLAGASSGSGLGQFASASRIWEAVVRMLVAVVRHVRVEDEIFDEVLALLADRLGRDAEVRDALEVINADAVWFAMYEMGALEAKTTPKMEGVVFPDM